MSIYIDKVTVYCDTDDCDSKVAVGNDSDELNQIVTADSWGLDQIADTISGWDIEMQANGINLVRCPACAARYWDSVGMREEEKI